MPLSGVIVIMFGTAATWLLISEGNPAERRLEALVSPSSPRRRTLPAQRTGDRVRWIVSCVPGGTLILLLGPATGLTVGLPIGCLLWWWLYRRGSRLSRYEQSRAAAGLPIAVDLMVAGLRAGGTMPEVLTAVSTAVGGQLRREFGDVAERLRLGADPAMTWRGLRDPPELAAIGRTLARAAETGAPVADLLERHAAATRRSVRTRALARSQRLSVLVAAPLGLCFLPAFALIGVVPLAAGLISDLALP